MMQATQKQINYLYKLTGIDYSQDGLSVKEASLKIKHSLGRRGKSIKCSSCGDIVGVGGKVWHFRLRHSERDSDGNYLGWNCDRCADRIEGAGCY